LIISVLYNHKPHHVNQDSTIYFKEQALDLFLKFGETSAQIEALKDLGIALKNFSRYSEGEKYLFDALELSEKNDDKPNISNCYRILCDFCRHKKDYKAAIHYGELAAKFALDNNLEEAIQYDPLWCLITAYKKNGQPEIAIQKADELLAYEDETIIPYNKLAYLLNERIESSIAIGNIDAAIADKEKIMLKAGIAKEDFSNSQDPLYLYLKKDYGSWTNPVN